MNQLFSLRIILIFIGVLAFSQEKIKVTYEVIPFYEPAVKDDISLTAIPSLHELLIDGNESHYDYVPRINNNQQDLGTGVAITASIQSYVLGTYYKNTKDNLLVEESKIDNKSYLIKDQLPKIDWKITKESKLLGEFTTYKATAILNEYEITAWYCPKLNFKTGPEKYWGLPGLILEVEETLNYEDGGKEGNTYKFISLETIQSKDKIKIPTKGKVVTKLEFDQEQKLANERMMEMYGGGVEKD